MISTDSTAGFCSAIPHSYRSVRNSQTDKDYLFAKPANKPAANSQTKPNLPLTKIADSSVCGKNSVCGYVRKQEGKTAFIRKLKSGKLGLKSVRQSHTGKRSEFDAGNLAAARLILDRVEEFGGPESGLARWASAVNRRLSNRPFQASDASVNPTPEPVDAAVNGLSRDPKGGETPIASPAGRNRSKQEQGNLFGEAA